MGLLKNIKRFKSKHFPTQFELMIKKWYADDGDNELRFNYDLGEKSIVLDLGGYQGQWASDLFARYKCIIYIFEPVKDFAERIKKRFRHNDQIEVFTYGLGGSTHTESIHLSADGSSVFGESANTEQIDIVDVKNWLNEHQIDNVDLIKINIEGGEYELLDRLIETNLIAKMDNIQVQFHNFTENAQSEMERIQKDLAKTHEPTYQYEFVWENWARKK
jgi:FkbM family methyltransferase